MLKEIKGIFILVVTIGLSVLAIVVLKGRGKYLAEKLKLELEKKKLKDKTDKLEAKRQKNLSTIEDLDKKGFVSKDKIAKKVESNRKLEEKIEKVKKDVSVKDSSIQDLMKEIEKI